MSKCKILIYLFLILAPSLVLAEDPFDNSIFTFENDVPASDQLAPIDSFSNDDVSSQQATQSPALDQPINNRYHITRYSLEGLIKSVNKTQMMFVALDANVKFMISLNDCLGLDCAYVTEIDKRGRVTFEDEKGIYRFQVGAGSYIVEQKGVMTPGGGGLFDNETAQMMADLGCMNASTIEGVQKDACQCLIFNFWSSFSIEDINEFNLKGGKAFVRSVYGEEPDENMEFMGKYAQAIGSDPLPSGEEIPVITKDQALRGAKAVTIEMQDTKNFKQASEYCQTTLDITESELIDWMLEDEYIELTALEMFPGLLIQEDSLSETVLTDENEQTNEVAIEDEVAIELESENNNLQSEILSLMSEIEILSNSNQELQSTIDNQKQSLNQQQEKINLLLEETQNVNSSSDLNENVNNTEIQKLENTIVSLKSEINTKEQAVDFAENRMNELDQKVKELEGKIQDMSAVSENTENNENTESQDLVENEVSSLDVELEKKNNLLRESANKISSQLNQIEELENKINDLEAQINNPTEDKDVLTTSENDTNSSVEALESEEELKESEAQQEKVDTLVEELEVLPSKEEINEAIVQLNTEENELKSNSSDDESLTNIENNTISVTESTEENQNLLSTETNDKIMIAKEDVNIREQPSPHSGIIDVLLQNTEVNVVDTVQGWYKIILKDGKDGYVYSPMLKEKY